MNPTNPLFLTRRQLFRVASGVAVGVAGLSFAGAEDFPVITRPRATSGDAGVEPDWEARFSITVGPDKADIVGVTDRALQAAVEYVVRRGGGTVKVLPGVYRLRAPVRLYDHVKLQGSGPDTLLIKEPSVETALVEDSDWYDQEITLADPSGFQVGDAVCIRAVNSDTKAPVVIKRILVARSGNRFKLDRALRENTWKIGNATVATLFPVVTAEEAVDFSVEDICLDGNKDHNANLDGNYAGCVWIQDCSRVVLRNVIARNYNGDGLSWQVCHEVKVEGCQSVDNTGLGMHPGSGSQRTVIRNNVLERNNIGIFFCWGVQYGLAEKNTIRDNRDCGISIGHRDHENLIRENEILNSGKTGILFRPERGEGFTATGNRVERNRVVDSGAEDGIAIDIQGVTSGNTLQGNTLLETRSPARCIGIRLGPETGDTTLVDNHMEGFAVSVADNRSSG